MTRVRCRHYYSLILLLAGLGLLGLATPSWALSGFRRVVAYTNACDEHMPSLHLWVDLALEDGDPMPPQGLAALEVTGPDGTVYDMLNSEATNSTYYPAYGIWRGVSFPDDDGDGVPDIPLGDYVFRLETSSGEVFTESDTLPPIPSLAAPTRLTPEWGARLTTLTPTFTWEAVAGAGSYQVRIYSSDRWGFIDPQRSRTAPRLNTANNRVAYSPNVAGTSFTLPPGVLSPGRTYYWRVYAFDAPPGATWHHRVYTCDRIPFSVAGPYGEVKFAQGIVATGETQRAAVRLVNTAARPVTVLLRTWLGLPTGQVHRFRPRRLKLAASTVRVLEVYEHTFQNADPVGAYVVGVQLLDPKTGHRIGNERVSSFTYTGAP
jgi:hypothetical protein